VKLDSDETAAKIKYCVLSRASHCYFYANELLYVNIKKARWAKFALQQIGRQISYAHCLEVD
jgi:hypothetical protein